MKAKLYSLTLSHPSRAARLMLELKGIDHEVVEEVLQPIPRRIFRWGAARSRELRRWLAELSGIPMPAVAAALNTPVARHFVRLSDASEERVRADLAALPGILDRVDGLIAAGTIGAASVNAADCQIASTVRVLLAYEDLAPIVEHRPSAELAMRVFASYPSPIPLPLPSAWLPAG